MKKNKNALKYRGLTKLFKVMKITVLLIFVFTVQTVASSYAQSTKLSLSMNDVTFRDFIAHVEAETDFYFMLKYDDDILEKHFDLDYKNAPISEILDDILINTGYSYKIVDRYIAISKIADNPNTGQQKDISGTVTDESGEPLPGVTVVVKGTTNGVVTGANGSYSISNISDDAVLVFSFVGLQAIEVPVAGKSVIDVVMSENIEALEEVVVTALNINRKKQSLGYALTAINSGEINQAKETNMINSLKGKVAGLQISQTAGGVGSSSRVVLRGVSSLSSSNRPLFVIDGVPMGDGNNANGGISYKDMGNAMSEIDPENVESISVLKGAGASAAYGSRGANGVILITTKKGRGKGFGVSYSSNYTIDQPVLYTELQNIYGAGLLGSYPPIDESTNMPVKSTFWTLSFGPKMEGQLFPNFAGQEVPFTPQPNNVLDFYRNGSTCTNSLTFDAGNENANFILSLTNVNSKGISPNNDLARQVINMRGTMKMGKKVEIDSKISYIHQTVDNRVYMQESAGNAMWMLTIMPRNTRLGDLKNNTVDADGYELKFQDEPASNNPYWTLNNLKNNDEKHHVISFLSTKVDLASWLNFKVQTGLDYNNLTTHEHYAAGSSEPRLNILGGLSNILSNNIEWNSDFMFNANKDLSDKISTSLSAGGNYRYSRYNTLSQSGTALNAPGLYHISNANEYETGLSFGEKAVYSAYSLGSITYNQWLYFDVSLRNDWSSTLPKGNNSYFYHSENLSFLFTKALGIDSNFLSAGRLRGSYGKVGNDTSPYRTNQYYGFNQSNYAYPLGTIGSLATSDLKPEITESWEVGTNLTFFNNRLEFDFTYYDNLTRNQIMAVEIPSTSSYSSKVVNAGEVKNTGMEMLLNAGIIQNEEGFNWDVSINAAKNYSEVIALHENLESLKLAGFFSILSIEARPGEPFGSIYSNVYLRDDFGDIYVDDNGNPVKGDIEKVGNINPDLTGGINNKFTYKNFSLSFLIDFQLGGDFISGSKFYQYTFGTHAETLQGREEYYATHNADGSAMDGVIPDGPKVNGININTGEPNEIPLAPYTYYTNPYSMSVGEEFVLDATNVRMREVVIGYNMPSKLMDKTPLKNANISLVGRNLFFLYRANNYADSESGYSSGNVGTGIEHSPLPSTRSIGMQLKVNF
ncbi:SusC/RagA family TonB-linked outer membrane protein [Maribellus comscasis]|uniref:SusC/RagA family TonB-linked outer membrane protein n=2 Tax=Maribellus comscasis TaxID=2681766 RepID=A0A6I6JQW3_9BACT|nr:SusC/RagA family TonB-linked outer membrane protein [Maribellus comscasis]